MSEVKVYDMIKDMEYIARLRADKTRILEIGKKAFEGEVDERVAAFEKQTTLRDFSFGIAYRRFGESYARAAAYEKAVACGKTALAIFSALERTDAVRSEMEGVYRNISNAYHSLCEDKTAWEFSLQCAFLELEKYPEPYHPERELFFERVSNIYACMEDYENAIAWAYKGLDFEEKMHGGRLYFCSRWRERLAFLYREMGDVEKEVEQLWFVVELEEKRNEAYQEVFVPSLYDAWKRLLEIFEAQGTPEKAACFYEKFTEMSVYAGEEDEW